MDRFNSSDHRADSVRLGGGNEQQPSCDGPTESTPGTVLVPWINPMTAKVFKANYLKSIPILANDPQ
jgi:hypothetical protein